jgi:uncharacterized protein YbaR (Trm112 family)
MSQDYMSQILVCPQSNIPLKRLSANTWKTIKSRLGQNTVYTAFNKEITPQSGMIRKDQNSKTATYFYPIADGLIYLMPNDAIQLSDS